MQRATGMERKAAFCTSGVSLLRPRSSGNICSSIPSSRVANRVGLRRWRWLRYGAAAPTGSTSGMKMQSGEENSVPIDAPAGVLLAISSVLAIASVGCVFELSGGHPQYGQTVTSGILAVSLPSFLGMFYAAIRKGQAEAEED